MTTDDDRPDVGLGKAIELRRIELGLKRRELAERARLSYPYISEIENGVKEPSAKALRQIAEALDMKVATLAALSERIEERPASGTLLMSTPEPLQDSMALDDGARQYVGTADASGARQVLRLSAEQHRADAFDEQIRDAVSREINTWLRDVLPAIVRAEVERQLDARLGGDASEGGDGR